MAKFTAEELENQRRIIGIIMKGDAEKKKHYDVVLDRLVKAMRTAMPAADDDLLADFATSVAYVVATLQRTPLQEVGGLMNDLFEGYEVAAAFLAGCYDPKNPEVPDYTQPDLSALGLDPETLKQFQEFQKQQAGTDVPHAGASDVYWSGQYL